MNEKTFRQLVEILYDGVIVPQNIFKNMEIRIDDQAE